ncbi:hypothetical protein ACFPRL_00940 [Pseudoclavibacter helvolus]
MGSSVGSGIGGCVGGVVSPGVVVAAPPEPSGTGWPVNAGGTGVDGWGACVAVSSPELSTGCSGRVVSSSCCESTAALCELCAAVAWRTRAEMPLVRSRSSPASASSMSAAS